MKIYFDFENKEGPIATSLQQILPQYVSFSLEGADVVVTDCVDKVLHYLQKTQLKLVQFSHQHHYAMTHLMEDYPNRFRVAVEGDGLEGLLKELAYLRDLKE